MLNLPVLYNKLKDSHDWIITADNAEIAQALCQAKLAVIETNHPTINAVINPMISHISALLRRTLRDDEAKAINLLYRIVLFEKLLGKATQHNIIDALHEDAQHCKDKLNSEWQALRPQYLANTNKSLSEQRQFTDTVKYIVNFGLQLLCLRISYELFNDDRSFVDSFFACLFLCACYAVKNSIFWIATSSIDTSLQVAANTLNQGIATISQTINNIQTGNSPPPPSYTVNITMNFSSI